MTLETRYFGKVEIEEEKIIHFKDGIPGFDEYKDYTIIYDIEEESEPLFSWLQCITEKNLAFPIVNPFRVKEDFDPVVEDELLKDLGEFESEDLAVFLLATVPSDVTKTTVNMKAPIIVNTKNRQAVQIIVENDDYEIRHALLAENK